MRRAILLFVSLAIIATCIAAVAAEQDSLSLPLLQFPQRVFLSSLHQGIFGNITIANTQPLCSNTGPVPTQGPTLTAQSPTGQTVIPVHWTLYYSCSLTGTFQARLNTGTYSLTLVSCGPPGSAQACYSQPNPPITVQVQPGKLTPVNIQITTGIY